MSTDVRPAPVRLLRLAAFASTLDRFAMPPMLLAISRDLGAPLTRIVQAAGVYFLAYGLMQPVWGMVSDRVGLVRTMRITLLAAALATAASAAVDSALALAVTRSLAGACFSATVPAGLIYLGDTVPAPRRQRGVTDLMVGAALGIALASAGAGLLAQLLSWRIAFLLTGALAAVLVVALRGLPAPPRLRHHASLLGPVIEAVRSGPTRLLLLLAFVDGVVLLGALTLLPAAVEAAGTGAALAGGVTAVYGLAVLIFARVTGVLSRRLAAWRLIALGAGAAVIGCTVAAVSQAPAVVVVVATLIGLAWAALHSSLQTWATEVLPSARAAVVSLFSGALFLGSAAAALVAAGPAEAGRYGLIFTGAAVLAVPLGFLAALGRARWTGPPGMPDDPGHAIIEDSP